MNVVVRHRIMSIEDFLAWEARQEVKYEFDGYEPVAMAGGSLNHALIQRNLAVAIGSRLRGHRCGFFGSDLKVVFGTRSRYPDGQILCGPQDGRATFSTEPVALFEVVSPSDDARDRVVKLAEYLWIASVRTYVILEQDRVLATVMTRNGDAWSSQEMGPDAVLLLPDVGIGVPIFEFYEGARLEDAAAAAAR